MVGESGCGKSTLLRTLMMLMEENCQIDKGAVFFEETDLTKLSEKELRLLRGKDIVMIFQNAALSSNPLHKIGHQFYETITSHSGKCPKRNVMQRRKIS
ncbi:MAG: ATP-binding cassette domain-containing protein [Acutalibacteraceae bacterium]